MATTSIRQGFRRLASPQDYPSRWTSEATSIASTLWRQGHNEFCSWLFMSFRYPWAHGAKANLLRAAPPHLSPCWDVVLSREKWLLATILGPWPTLMPSVLLTSTWSFPHVSACFNASAFFVLPLSILCFPLQNPLSQGSAAGSQPQLTTLRTAFTKLVDTSIGGLTLTTSALHPQPLWQRCTSSVLKHAKDSCCSEALMVRTWSTIPTLSCHHACHNMNIPHCAEHPSRSSTAGRHRASHGRKSPREPILT